MPYKMFTIQLETRWVQVKAANETSPPLQDDKHLFFFLTVYATAKMNVLRNNTLSLFIWEETPPGALSGNYLSPAVLYTLTII